MEYNVVIDTNVLISAFINPKGLPSKLLEFWKKGYFRLLISDYLIEEFNEVIHRPKIKDKYKIREEEITELNQLILEKAILINIKGDLKLCRDITDNKILETAIIGKANYLITGDIDILNEDLLKELSMKSIKIIGVREYLRVLMRK
ncbi:MAG: putative toxin-antitoxin system toxin component, PIN family [Actinomycetia bacterium]|nr:putative toxin-antitoxin system toxin component, PIN family [Actinomycetes bacterium]